MKPLKEHLNLQSTNLIEVILSNSPEGRTPREWFRVSQATVKAKVEPVLLEHLKSLNLPEEAKKYNSIQELEEATINPLPDNFTGLIADAVDHLVGFSPEQKMWFFSLLFSDFYHAVQEAAGEVFRLRAQQLATIKRPKLILP